MLSTIQSLKINIVRFKFHTGYFFVGLVLVMLLVSGCADHWFYRPNRLIYAAPEQYNLEYKNVYFESRDNTLLHGMLLFAQGQAVYGTVIHFHGNYGNISYNLNQVSWLPAAGFQVFLFDYRGYGQSAGQPSRAAIADDAYAALNYLMNNTSGAIFVFGQSLGGAVAVTALADHLYPRIKAVIIEGTFYAYRKQAVSVMSGSVSGCVNALPCLMAPLIPLSYLLVSNQSSPGHFIHKISPIPLLIVHGDADKLVPYRHANLLYEAAQPPKAKLIVPNGGHLNLFTSPYNGYQQCFIQFLKNPGSCPETCCQYLEFQALN